MANGDDDRGASPATLDIKALLSVALGQQPRGAVQERVMNRVAFVTTATEFVRLLCFAPVHWLVAERESRAEDGDDKGRGDDDTMD
ncbi:MAG TPA: hypothetical protein ENJ18_07895 [Nannocystis exedens]|nr:hypothetical protein [Nannocystis exedens]